jgi:hypothetical protein
MKFDTDKYINLATTDLGYNQEQKTQFLNMSRRLGRILAERLGISNYDLRTNKAGIAVSGEVTLHTDTIYVQLGQGFINNGFLARKCNGKKDYAGGRNHIVKWEALRDLDKVVSFLKEMA